MRLLTRAGCIFAVSSLGVLVACSSPALPSTYESGGKGGTSADDGSGQFGDGDNSDGTSSADTGPCVPAKGNYDIPGNNCDDDGDGKVDNPPTCDSADTSPEGFAKAMGICASASKDGYGLVSATFTRGYKRTDAPNAQQHGILGKFGNVLKPREGAFLGVLSSGVAQEFDGSSVAFGAANPPNGGGIDFFDSDSNPGNGTAPPGFPKAAGGCPISNKVNDVIDLVLTLKAPANGTGLAFDFNFLSGEWPIYICSEFNDGFVAYLTAKGFNGGQADNISFDKDKNPVSVNNGFFDRCTPNVKTGCDQGTVSKQSVCPGGTAELAGTGFGQVGNWCNMTGSGGSPSTNGGATGWLSSQAAVQPGETFTLELMIWDTGDGRLDSSVLLDNFRWLGTKVVSTGTTRPPS